MVTRGTRAGCKEADPYPSAPLAVMGLTRHVILCMCSRIAPQICPFVFIRVPHEKLLHGKDSLISPAPSHNPSQEMLMCNIYA